MKYTKVIVLALTMLPLLAAAQLPAREKVAAKIPFDFVVAGKVIPAGNCLIQLSPASDTLLVQNLQAKTGSFSSAHWNREAASDSYSLVFNQYGNRYFLRGVMANGTIYTLPVSKLEKELRAQNLSAHEKSLTASLN